MISEKIKNFITVVKNGSKVNTYKVAWAKALLEICSEEPSIKIISLEKIAHKIYKYYWNQTIYFDLLQGNNPTRRAAFLTEVRKDIEKYYISSKSRQPIHFERVEDKLDINIKKLVSILKLDVSWRFLKINGEVVDIYQYEKGDNELIIENASEYSDYNSMLSDVINYKWTQVLESFNNAPRIAKKIRVVDFPTLKRKSLTPFKKYLDVENPNHVCFICGNAIEKGKVAIDHVIPWSYMFSDDLWNFVYVHQSCNSSKSNIIPSEKEIISLEKRNVRLLEKFEAGNKIYDELKSAIDGDYVRKFWVGCK